MEYDRVGYELRLFDQIIRIDTLYTVLQALR